MPFQTTTNYQPGNAVAGDFASTNPRANVLSGPGGLVAGVGGITVGAFGWVQVDGVTVLATGAAAPSGFLARQGLPALITAYLAESGNAVPAGFGVTLFNSGDFWATTTTLATVGQEVVVNGTTGVISTGAGVQTAPLYATGFFVGSAAAIGTLMKITSRVP